MNKKEELVKKYRNGWLSFKEAEELLRLTYDQPEIHEGFERWDGGDCPVPGDCDVQYMMRNVSHANKFYIDRAHAVRWQSINIFTDIIAYRVTHVPTLTIDDDIERYWIISGDGLIERSPFEGSSICYRDIASGMAYRTREHAETALKWGLLHDVYYTKMGFERPVI